MGLGHIEAGDFFALIVLILASLGDGLLDIKESVVFEVEVEGDADEVSKS